MYLNVFAPAWAVGRSSLRVCYKSFSMAYYVYIGAGTDARLPVVAVIYGGSLVGGATNLLNMTALVAANNIVAVTMNYR